VLINPDDLYYQGKYGLNGWLEALKSLGGGLYQDALSALKNTKDLSTRKVANIFRDISKQIWSQNALASFNPLHNRLLNPFASLWGISDGAREIPIRREFNNRLWTHNADGTLNHITSDDLAPLFPEGNPEAWPNLVLTSNHARAWQSSDLSDLMKGIERLGHDAGGKPLDLHRLKHKETFPDVTGKTIIALACHTEKDIYLNGAELIDRRLDLEEDPNKGSPDKRSINHMSPAAMRLAKLMIKLMVEPGCGGLVNLDRSDFDHRPEFRNAPFIANDLMLRGSEDPRYTDKHPLILRKDAASIAQHIKLLGYSKGANTVTDALRFVFLEYAKLGELMQIREPGGTLRKATDKDISTLISNIGLLSVAPGEVPLTKAEKYEAGITRVTIHNTEDLTAGHLVNPQEKDYDPWSDKLIQIKGTSHEMGHSIVAALGKDSTPGFIMNPENAKGDRSYQAAQDAVRAFFASNFQKHAITTLCFSHNADERRNELYVQFAPGITRADEKKIEKDLLKALKKQNIIATAESDLTHRKRVQIVLSRGTDKDIETDAGSIQQCQKAFEALKKTEGSNLLLSQDVDDYMARLLKEDTVKHAQRVDKRGNEGNAPGHRRW
jgi:hypothetical protein